MDHYFTLKESAYGFAVRYCSFELFKLLHSTVSQREVFPKKNKVGDIYTSFQKKIRWQ